jgi:hypothetical protein
LLERKTGDEYTTGKRFHALLESSHYRSAFHDGALLSRSKTTRQDLIVLVNREEGDLLGYCRAY